MALGPFTPTIRGYTRATSLEPTDAFELDRIGVGTMYIEGADLAVGAPYEKSWEFLGDPALSSEILGGGIFTVAVDFPSGFGGVGFCDPDTLPIATFTANIYQIAAGTPTLIGTMEIATDGAFTFTVPATSFAAGDSIKFLGPSVPDATAANFWWALLGATA